MMDVVKKQSRIKKGSSNINVKRQGRTVVSHRRLKKEAEGNVSKARARGGR